MRQELIIMGFILLISGCIQRSEETYTNTGIIESKFIESYNRFIFEGKRRGLDFSNIKIEIVEDNNSFYPGQCNYNKKRIIINLEMIQNYMNQNENDWYYDFVMNHELAHCILNLKHGDGLMVPNFPDFLVGTYWIERENLLDKIFGNKIINLRVKSN